MTDDAEFNVKAHARRIARMKQIDALCPEMRAVVHDYGFSLVDAFMSCGVMKPNRVRHLIERVMDEMSPTRGSSSAQGPGHSNARRLTEAHLAKGGYEA